MQALRLWTLLATYAVAVGQNQGQKNQECPKLNAQVLSFKSTRENTVVMFSVNSLFRFFCFVFFVFFLTKLNIRTHHTKWKKM